MTGKVDQRNRTVRVCACAPVRAVGERKEGGGGGRWGVTEGEIEGEKVKECHCSSVPVYHPLLSCSYKSNRTKSLLALRHDTDHWHTEHCQNHLDG